MVLTVAFGPDGRTLASGSVGGDVRLWNVRAREPLGEPLGGHAGQNVEDVVFSKDGRTLASAGSDGTVRLWDVAGRRERGQPLRGHVGAVFGVAFTPDGRTVASGGDDKTVRLWEGILWGDLDDLEAQVCGLVVRNLSEPEWEELVPGLVIPHDVPDVGRQSASVGAVIARMEAILEPLPRRDGVASFTRLYLEVTRAVQTELESATFADPAFLEKLDIVFADLFFDALEAHESGPGDAPRAWAPLFECRSKRGIAPLQYALAGMNAHINRDLPVALVTTWTDTRIDPGFDSRQHADFERVNDVLARVEQRVKREYLTGWLNAIDRLLHRFHRLDSILAMWNVRSARAAAWVNGEALWALRGDAKLGGDYLRSLDRMVGLSSRGLLVPADTSLRKADRQVGRLRRDPLWWV